MKAKGIKTLILSLIAIAICFTMLLDTTFAWFTDSVSSSGNVIKSGTVSAGIGLFSEGTGWSNTSGDTVSISDNTGWENGHTDQKVLKVENDGTLPLDWKAMLILDNELSALADVVDVYVITSKTEISYSTDLSGYENKGSVAKFVNTDTESAKGILDVGDVVYLGIALKMQETAGDQYLGLDLGGQINVKITTKYHAEEIVSQGTSGGAIS